MIITAHAGLLIFIINAGTLCLVFIWHVVRFTDKKPRKHVKQNSRKYDFIVVFLHGLMQFTRMALIPASVVLCRASPLSASWSRGAWTNAGRPWALVNEARSTEGLCVLSTLPVFIFTAFYWKPKVHHHNDKTQRADHAGLFYCCWPTLAGLEVLP